MATVFEPALLSPPSERTISSRPFSFHSGLRELLRFGNLSVLGWDRMDIFLKVHS